MNYFNNENDVKFNFENITDETFLCRVLKCFGIELKYSLDNNQLCVKDIINNEVLKRDSESYSFNNNNVNFDMWIYNYDSLKFFIKLKRPEYKVTMTVEQEEIACKNDENKYEYSKYGNVEIQDHKHGVKYTYNSKCFNHPEANNYIISIASNSNTLYYDLREIEKLTMHNNSLDDWKEVDEFIPFNNDSNLLGFKIQNKYVFQLLMPLINSDIKDLEDILNSKEYLKRILNTKMAALKEAKIDYVLNYLLKNKNKLLHDPDYQNMLNTLLHFENFDLKEETHGKENIIFIKDSIASINQKLDTIFKNELNSTEESLNHGQKIK